MILKPHTYSYDLHYIRFNFIIINHHPSRKYVLPINPPHKSNINSNGEQIKMLITGKQYAYKLITYFKNVIIKMYDFSDNYYAYKILLYGFIFIIS